MEVRIGEQRRRRWFSGVGLKGQRIRKMTPQVRQQGELFGDSSSSLEAAFEMQLGGREMRRERCGGLPVRWSLGTEQGTTASMLVWFGAGGKGARAVALRVPKRSASLLRTEISHCAVRRNKVTLVCTSRYQFIAGVSSQRRKCYLSLSQSFSSILFPARREGLVAT